MTTQMPPRPPAGPGGPSSGGATPGGGGMKLPPIDQLKNRPLGRVLIKMGRLTREQVHKALAVQQEQKAKGTNTPIGQILVDLGLISDKDRNIALAAQQGFEVYELEGKEIPKDVIDKVPAQMAISYKAVPVEFDPKTKTLKIVVSSPDNFRAVDDLRSFLGINVTVSIADGDQINKILSKHYGLKEESLGTMMQEISS